MKENGANDFSQKPKVDMETEKAKSAAAGAVAGAAGMAAALWASGMIGNEEEEKAEQKADKEESHEQSPVQQNQNQQQHQQHQHNPSTLADAGDVDVPQSNEHEDDVEILGIDGTDSYTAEVHIEANDDMIIDVSPNYGEDAIESEDCYTDDNYGNETDHSDHFEIFDTSTPGDYDPHSNDANPLGMDDSFGTQFV
ncbi:unknown [Bacteroides sp. CAG:530]|nr:unknown [Bacteroides sp. CAG:530]